MFVFGVVRQAFPRPVAMRIERIAGQRGAWFATVDLPEGPTSWFTGPNLGDPFNALLAKAVLTALSAAGIAYSGTASWRPACTPVEDE